MFKEILMPYSEIYSMFYKKKLINIIDRINFRNLENGKRATLFSVGFVLSVKKKLS